MQIGFGFSPAQVAVLGRIALPVTFAPTIYDTAGSSGAAAQGISGFAERAGALRTRINDMNGRLAALEA